MIMKGKARFVLSAAAAFVLAAGCLGGAVSVGTAAEETEGTAEYVESFDFTTVQDFSDLTMFSAGIDPATNSDALGYTSDAWVTYAKELDDLFTLENGLKVDTSVYSGNDVSENNIYVRYNAKSFRYFTAELVYSYDDDTRNGWAGFMFGYTNFTRKARWGDSPAGVEMFVQKDGQGTYSSARLNNSNYTEGVTPENWTAVGEHTLTITATGSGVILTADGTEVISVTAAEMEEAGYELTSASMGFYLTNAAFTAKKFSVSPLNAAGDPYQSVESISVAAPAQAEQFAAVEVQPTVTPADATMQDIGYILPDCAVANGNKLYFVQPGEYTVTAYSVDDPTKTDEFTIEVTAAENYSHYPATAAAAAENFDNYYVSTGGAKDGTMYPVENYWNFNEDGSMTLKEKYRSGVDAGYVLLYLKDIVNGQAITTNSFELTYMVRTTLETPNGWHGVGFTLGDRSTVPNQEGISAFIQEEALKATIWGSGAAGVSGPFEADSAYTRGEWNLIKVKVYGEGTSRIEMYINDMETPVITYSATNMPSRELALFTTTIITIKDIYYAPLDADGNTVETVYPQSVEILNDFTGVTAGDQVQLNVSLTPEDATDNTFSYSSSNALVATVNASGLVTFLNAGQTTLTVRCNGDPSVYDEVTVTVVEKEVLPTAVSFDVTPSDAVVGGRYTLLVTVTPDNVTDYGVRFTSSDESVATVDDEGRLSYVGAGETVITVICTADESVTASFTLTVRAAEGTSSGTSSGTSAGNGAGGCGSFLAGGTAIGIAALGFAALQLRRKRK